MSEKAGGGEFIEAATFGHAGRVLMYLAIHVLLYVHFQMAGC